MNDDRTVRTLARRWNGLATNDRDWMCGRFIRTNTLLTLRKHRESWSPSAEMKPLRYLERPSSRAGTSKNSDIQE